MKKYELHEFMKKIMELRGKKRIQSIDYRDILSNNIYIVNSNKEDDCLNDDLGHLIKLLEEVVEDKYSYMESNYLHMILSNENNYQTLDDIENQLLCNMDSVLNYNQMFHGIVLLEIDMFNKRNFSDVVRRIQKLKNNNIFIIINRTGVELEIENTIFLNISNKDELVLTQEEVKSFFDKKSIFMDEESINQITNMINNSSKVNEYKKILMNICENMIFSNDYKFYNKISVDNEEELIYELF